MQEVKHGGKQLNYCECFKSTYVCRLQTSTNGEYWEAETTGKQRHSGAMYPALPPPTAG